MKYNLLLHLRLVVFTLIVPSSLLASSRTENKTEEAEEKVLNEVKSQTEDNNKVLNECVDELCDAIGQMGLELHSYQIPNSKFYTAFIKSGRLSEELPYLAHFLQILISKNLSKTPYTIDRLKDILKAHLISAIPQADYLQYMDYKKLDGTVLNPFFIFMEFYAGSMKPLSVLNAIAGTKDKPWKYFKEKLFNDMEKKTFKWLDPPNPTKVKKHVNEIINIVSMEESLINKFYNPRSDWVKSNLLAFMLIGRHTVESQELDPEAFLSKIKGLKDRNDKAKQQQLKPNKDKISDLEKSLKQTKILISIVFSLFLASCFVTVFLYFQSGKKKPLTKNRNSLIKKKQKRLAKA